MGKILRKIIAVFLLIGVMVSLMACKKNKILDVKVGTYVGDNGAKIEILPNHRMLITGYDFDAIQADLGEWLIEKAALSDAEASDFRNSLNFNERMVGKELPFELYTDMYEDTGSMSIWLFKILDSEQMTTYFTLVYYPASDEIVMDTSIMTMGQVNTTSEVFTFRK